MHSHALLHVVLECDTTSHLCGIGKGISLKKFKSSIHFREQAKVFDAQSASPKMSLLQDCKHWFVCTMGNLQMDLIRCVISVSARRRLPKHLIFNHRLCHPLQLQQSTTISVYTFRYNNGKVLGLNLGQ